MAITATVGGASSNSYVTSTEMSTYCGTRFGSSAYTGLTSGNQEIALVQAAREIDRLRFKGSKNSTTQALQFPRAYPYNADDPTTSTAATIPTSVKQAQMEQALHLATNYARGGLSQRQQLQAQGVTSFRVGDLSETYGSAGANLSGHTVCAAAMSLLQKWIERGGTIYTPGREEIADDSL